MLQTQKQNEWFQLFSSLNDENGSVQWLNRYLLHKTLTTHPLNVLGDTAYLAIKRVEFFVDVFKLQLFSYHGTEFFDMTDSLHTINEVDISIQNFTTPVTIEYFIKKLPKHSTPGIDCNKLCV